MESTETAKVSVEVSIDAAPEMVWDCFNNSEHITEWNASSDDWHTPKSTNKLHVGGQFNHRMEAKAGSFGFDFIGIYTEVITNKKISYSLEDGRIVEIFFEGKKNGTKLSEVFVAETANLPVLQRAGWQAILDNFKKHVENL